MTTRRLFVLGPVCVAALAVAFPLSAQEAGTGTWINGREPSSAPVNSAGWVGKPPAEMAHQLSGQGLAVARQMAGCVLKRNRKGAERFLASLDYSLARASYDRMKVTISNCVMAGAEETVYKREMNFSVGTLHSLLAEAWILDFGLAKLGLVPVEVSAIKDKMSHDNTPQAILQTMAWCLMRTHPQEVSALLVAPIGSPSEKAAFGSVTPAVPRCMDRNVTLQTNRNSLRLELSSIAYTMQREAVEDPSLALRK